MKVILLEDVKSLGKKGEIVTASDAYARNILIPKKLGVEATPTALNDLKLQQKHAEKVAQENYDKAVALKEELKGTDIEVAYGIDQKADSIFSDINVVSPEYCLDNVDAIVVTAIHFFDEIEEKLSEKVDCPILSLEDILYEM